MNETAPTEKCHLDFLLKAHSILITILTNYSTGYKTSLSCY